MKDPHEKLWERQFKKASQSANALDLDQLRTLVVETYREMDRERRLTERSLDLVSQELGRRSEQIREESTRKLQSKDEFIRQLLQHLAQGLLVASNHPMMAYGGKSAFLVDLVNDEAARLIEKPRTEVLGSNLARVLPITRFEDFEAKLLRVYAGGWPESFEWEFHGESGARAIRSTIRRLDDRLVLSFVDLSEEREVQHALRQARDTAEEAARTKAQFLSNMSHEIRTPMNGILGMTELLLDLPIATDARELATTAHECARSLLNVINDVLDFSKIEAGKVELLLEPFSLKELLQRTLRMHQVLADRRGIRIDCHISQSCEGQVFGDPARLQQVLNNLIANAVKFSHDGAIVTVEVARIAAASAEGDPAKFRILIHDRGIGIATAQHARIFAAFSQADASTTRRFGGSGLGLSICRELLSLMRGHIFFASEEGVGSTFAFTIPLAVIEEADVATPLRPSPVTQSGEPEEQPLRILVAEDNLVNQRLISLLLTRAGHAVVLAENGAIAVERFEREDFDCVFLDIQMPVMGGVQALEALRRMNKAVGVPIIALTAHALSGDRERYLRAGFDGYLTKPIDRAALSEALRTVVPRSS